MVKRRGRKVELVCDHCSLAFIRVAIEAGRSKDGRSFCSRVCSGAARRGRAMVSLFCECCFRPFERAKHVAARHEHHYCGRDCFLACVDRVALGRAGGAAARPASPAMRFLRSQAAGFARARNLTPERMREIALMGVAARRAARERDGRLPRMRSAKFTRGRSFLGPLLLATARPKK